MRRASGGCEPRLPAEPDLRDSEGSNAGCPGEVYDVGKGRRVGHRGYAQPGSQLDTWIQYSISMLVVVAILQS